MSYGRFGRVRPLPCTVHAVRERAANVAYLQRHLPGLTVVWDRERLAKAAREDGIRRCEENAPPEWKAAACNAVAHLCRTRRTWTVDDIWDHLQEARVPPPPNPAALGPVLLAAARRGLCRKTYTFRPSRRVQHHGDLMVWESAAV